MNKIKSIIRKPYDAVARKLGAATTKYAAIVFVYMILAELLSNWMEPYIGSFPSKMIAGIGTALLLFPVYADRKTLRKPARR